MIRRRLPPLLLAVAAPAAFAQQEEPIVTVTGSNTARIERYGTSGDAAFTPYPTTGTTGFDAFTVEANWITKYVKWKANVDAVVNDSTYRSTERGFVPERLAVAHENGDVAIPYRVEAGDFYGFTTNRTLQRPLKGGSLDLQPGETGRQSILLFAGAFASNWRDVHWHEDNSMGLSWLCTFNPTKNPLNASVNLLRNERSPTVNGVTDRRTQQVATVNLNGDFSKETPQPWLKGWSWEAEASRLRGDHEDLGDGGRDKRDSGYFAQVLKGQEKGTYDAKVRLERYGMDFRPFGGSVIPDRRSGEAYLGWTTLGDGVHFEARAQDWRDNAESGNPLDTRTFGAKTYGTLSASGLTIYADVFRQTVERRDASVDQTTLSATGSVKFPVMSWAGELGFVLQKLDDALQPQASPRTHELSFTLTKEMMVAGGWKMTLTPGVVWRNVTNTPAGHRDLRGSLSLEMKRDDKQVFRLMANREGQDPTGAPDVATINLGLEYRHRIGQHEFGVDYVAFERKPEGTQNTRAYRAGLQWTYYLDKPPPMYSFGAPIALAAPAAAFARDLGVLTLPLGIDVDAALARIADAGFGAAARQPSSFVYETRVMPDVEGRQRLVVTHEAGRVERVAVIVSLAPGSAPSDAGRAYDAVMRAMIQQFGRPSATREEGTFGPGFANDLAMGRLARVAEWRLADGVLRVGIPRRLDGVARVEIQHARTLGSLRDSSWSLESIR
jgi:hypothetical protein